MVLLIIALALAIGVGLGVVIPFEFSAISSLYVSVGLLAAIDSIVGGIRASLEETFDTLIFVSGFFVNALLAIGLSYIGDRLGVPIYYAAIFVFGTRLFNNMGIIRRIFLKRLRKKA